MKILAAIFVVAASIALLIYAQSSGWRGLLPGGGPPDPIMELFDTDGDEQISGNEISDATRILTELDQDGSGFLTRNELPRPPRRGDDRAGNGRGGSELAVDVSSLAKGTVVFHGGYETDPRDDGRPVDLIAASLGVEPQVFRDAFSGVNPAHGRGPTHAEARANKTILMDALGKHGITNDRLDEVSNYYRYRPQSGELWTHTPAKATAVVEEGKVVAIKMTEQGAGYSSAPRIEIAGYPNIQVDVAIEFSEDLTTNGHVESLEVIE